MFAKNHVRIFARLDGFNDHFKLNSNEQKSIYSVPRTKKEEVNLIIKWIQKKENKTPEQTAGHICLSP